MRSPVDCDNGRLKRKKYEGSAEKAIVSRHDELQSTLLTRTKGPEKSGSLSDIDDTEVPSYLLNAKERQYKQIIWEKMNQIYLQEQAVKAVISENAAKYKKECQQRRASETKKNQEVTNASDKKRKSSKINYDALNKYFAPESSVGQKNRHTEPHSGNDDVDVEASGNDDADVEAESDSNTYADNCWNHSFDSHEVESEEDNFNLNDDGYWF